jgi:alpha-L-rhamnosidase
MERTGHFKCSHRLLNRLHKNVVYSALSNCISLPTDCPQRDERMGWTGDVQLFAPTLNFLFDGSGFLGGWLRDLHAEQGEDDGVVPLVVPTIVPHKFLNTPKAAWGDAGVLVPDDVYRSFGDTRILEQQFEPMVLWLDRGVRRDIETGLWDTNEDQFGDHLAPKTEGSNGVTDSHLIADAYLIHVTRVAARTSGLLGRHVNTERFAHAASDLLKAFHSTYVTARSRVVSDTQAALAVILHFDLIDPDVSGQREVMVKRLEQLVTKCLWQVATGFVATPIILHVLSENDLLHHAYRMLQAKDSPSWLAPVLLGATTVWERWDSMLSDGTINTDEMTSFNRYALGSVADFLHTVVGGISPLSPGWKQILFRPRPGGSVTSAKVSHLSPYGFILCAWEIKGDKLHVTINIPPNCTGRVSLPWLDETVGSGRREYVVDFEPDPRFPPKVVRKIYEGSVSNDWVR